MHVAFRFIKFEDVFKRVNDPSKQAMQEHETLLKQRPKVPASRYSALNTNNETTWHKNK